jgi:exodeoxyribonuclease VII large subunit
LDDFSMRLLALAQEMLHRKNELVNIRHDMLMQMSPNKSLTVISGQVAGVQQTLISGIKRMIRDRRTATAKSDSMLNALNPMAILGRGYSITRKLPEQTIVRSTRQVRIDQHLEVLLAKGKITVKVEEKHAKTR